MARALLLSSVVVVVALVLSTLPSAASHRPYRRLAAAHRAASAGRVAASQRAAGTGAGTATGSRGGPQSQANPAGGRALGTAGRGVATARKTAPQGAHGNAKRNAAPPHVAPPLTGANVCGGQCCPGWALNAALHKCNKPVCTPPCQNKGMCLRPQLCLCRPGFHGQSCEVANLSRGGHHPRAPDNSVPAAPAASVLLPGKQDPRAAPHGAHLPKTHNVAHVSLAPGGSAQTSAQAWSQQLRPRITGRDAPAQQVHLQAQPHVQARPGAQGHQALLQSGPRVLAVAPGKPSAGQAPQNDQPMDATASNGDLTMGAAPVPQRIKVVFTPTICTLDCSRGDCRHSCSKGNVTTLISEHGRMIYPPHSSRFRIVVCSIPCHNGGHCITKEKCFCQPGYTGKFCHLPADPNSTEVADAGNNGWKGSSTFTFPLSTLGNFSQASLANHPDLVKVHVKHPSEASVQIHQVARFSEDVTLQQLLADKAPRPEQHVPQPQPRQQPPQFPRVAHHQPILRQEPPQQPHIQYVQDKSVGELDNQAFHLPGYEQPRIPAATAPLGRCFREFSGHQCLKPLLGLTRQDDCCGSIGAAWGTNACTRCPPKAEHPVMMDGEVLECPQGFRKENSTHCRDINECQFRGICPNGTCINQQGSFRCSCMEGYLWDSFGQECMSDMVLSSKTDKCYRAMDGQECVLPIPLPLTKHICCCSVGKAWGKNCEKCPPQGLSSFKETCPAGMGYHFPSSEMKLNVRKLTDVEQMQITPERLAKAPAAVDPGRGDAFPGPPRLPQHHPPPKIDVYSSLDGEPVITALSTDNAQKTITGTDVHQTSAIQTPRRTSLPASTIVVSQTEALSVAQATVVNTCLQTPDICGHGECVHLDRGHTCVCNGGYKLNPSLTHCIDVDECARSPAPCPGGRCENTRGGFRCVCSQGYAASRGGTECIDVDECERADACGGNGRCVNTAGGYTCNCDRGYSLSTDKGRKTCHDVNECENTILCPGGRCVNLPGSHRCEFCDPGYQMSRKKECEDIDECQNPQACINKRCVNIPGAFECVLCPTGFKAAGTKCEDVNECLNSTAVCRDGRCIDLQGSYRCSCNPGFAPSGNGKRCDDVDECAERPCQNGECVNTPGSFKCSCPPGFQLSDGTNCRDIDECSTGNECEGGTCINTVGSFQCGCQPGFAALPGTDLCADVDECDNATACSEHQYCINSMGSFQCHCDQGYQTAKEGLGCVDINECETITEVCGSELCDNEEGTFLCICPNDYQEFDSQLGKCVPEPTAVYGNPSTPQPEPLQAGIHNIPGYSRYPEFVDSSEHYPQHPYRQETRLREPVGVPAAHVPAERRECYFNVNDENVCRNVLGRNVTRDECCCTVGAGWGTDCEPSPCPLEGTREFNELCPEGKGLVPSPNGRGYRDADECTLFSQELCRDSLCVNTQAGYKCYCRTGYLYDRSRLHCTDVDECENSQSCVDGQCYNSEGSYSCYCTAPLTLDHTGRRCVNRTASSSDVFLDICWKEVSQGVMCSKPVAGRQTTYTECCCLYGEAWGPECAFCPPKTSDDYLTLCNIRMRAEAQTFEEPHFGEQYPFEPHLLPAERGDFPPQTGAQGHLPFRGLTEMQPYPGQQENAGHDLMPGILPLYSTDDYNYNRYEGLQAEECGIAHGCENGRCVRVPEGFTCDCYEGYRLDTLSVVCVDVDECEEQDPRAQLCSNGHCVNTDGSYRCVCRPGYAALPQQPHACVPVLRHPLPFQ
uniref:Latent-transforming growth factor beta-binding protein 1-like n=1 Tax=Petromyzon marinus TaxID=7757 RepID=A0AAJ7WVL2_PETMA|nr:latent-transforming growth factor beta-binding protein 1-like [Petromyzon marinus]